MEELCQLEIDGGFDFAQPRLADLSPDQKVMSAIIMKNGYPCKFERYLPEGTGVWRVKMVIYKK